MRIFRHLLAAGALLALAGCGSDPAADQTAKDTAAAAKKEKAAKPAKGAKAEAVQVRFQPGRWETTMHMAKLDLGNVPPQVREALQSSMGRGRTFAYCLSPEDAQKPGSGFFNGDAKGNCTFDDYAVAGGRVRAKMTCKQGDDTQTVTLEGTYSSNTYAMTMSTSGSARGMPMLMTMSMESRRTGDCTGDEGR